MLYFAFRRRGSALLLAIFFLTVLFFLAMALLELLPTELRAAQRQRFSQAAYFAADAGVTEALAFLEKHLEQELEPALAFTVPTGANPHHKMSGSLGDWSWSVEIHPDAETPPRGTNSLRIYRITSTASLFEVPYRKITVDAGQESFAKYAMFYDQGEASLVWDVSRNRVEGPLHQNDVLRLYIPGGYFDTEGSPSFLGPVTSSRFAGPEHGDGVEYTGGGGKPYNKSGSPILERYQRMLSGGREALRTGDKTKEMPKNSRNLAEAAWGSETSAPPALAGVYLNSSVGTGDFNEALGGVFIQGDVDAMELGVSGGNSTVTITQGGKKSLLTVYTEGGTNLPAGTTVNGQVLPKPLDIPAGHTVLKKADGSYEVVSGTTNGVVYATGTIHSLRGVNRGARTVAVDIERDKEIVVSGDLTRADTPLGKKPSGSRDVLGLVGYNVRLGRAIPRSLNDPLYLYCTIFAGRKDGSGGYAVDGWDERWGEVGKFIIHGGLIEGQDKPWGYVGSSGFPFYEILYDSNLAKSPPPFFPMLPKLHIRSWTEEAQ
jgi:Tfp pilus assembly protein PilX